MVVVLRDDNGLGILNGNLRTIRPDLVPGVALINPRWDPSCPISQNCEPYFNPAAFKRPIKGQLGTAPRTFDHARGPTQQFFDLALQKSFQVREGTKIVLRAEAFNLLNHPNFAVPSNTQSPLTLGGNGDAVFRDAAGHFANNVGTIFSTVDSARQIQLGVRFLF